MISIFLVGKQITASFRLVYSAISEQVCVVDSLLILSSTL